MTKLTKAQRGLLLDMADAWQDTIYCDAGYKPAKALVDQRLAVWKREDRLAITDAGRAALSTIRKEGNDE